jgi:hypothetical protein
MSRWLFVGVAWLPLLLMSHIKRVEGGGEGALLGEVGRVAYVGHAFQFFQQLREFVAGAFYGG